MTRTIQVGILSLAMSLSVIVEAQTYQGGKEPCQCRDRDGQRRDLGSTDCFDISGTRALYRCEMSTNTPYWKRIDDQGGCPLALESPPRDPVTSTELASAH